MYWIILIVLSVSVIVAYSLDLPFQGQNATARRSLYPSIYAKYEGDIYMAALFSIHHNSVKRICGRIIDQDGLQVIEAATFALTMVQDEMKLPLRIGLLAVDTCQNPEYGLEQSKGFMLFKSCEQHAYVCADNKPPFLKEDYRSLQRVFGIFGAGNSDVTILAATFIRIVELPQISYFSTSPDLSDSQKFPGFFRTIPSDNYTVQAISDLLRRYRWNFIHIVSDDSKYSMSTKDSFTTFVKATSRGNNTICYTDTVISQKNIADDIKRIHDATNRKHSPKVVVTFLTQAVIEDMLAQVQSDSIVDFNKLVWIGTDSWGGRKWPNITKNNPMLNNSISVIPRAFDMPDFMKYYKGRRPSIDDYNPWLARKFERECRCQYSNISLFIYPELQKMRKANNSKERCEMMEEECSKVVFKDSKQMPYIHYVMDGVLAYATVIKSLIGSNCEGLNRSECAEVIWSNKTLNYKAIKTELEKVKFNDSTNEPFYFWKEREGIPNYSIMTFNTTNGNWNIVGSLLDYNESREEFKISIDEAFDQYVNTQNIIQLCFQPCLRDEVRTMIETTCCWICSKCQDTEIVNRSLPNKEFCQKCDVGLTPKEDKTGCKEIELSFLSLKDVGASIIFVVDMFGLLLCIVSIVCMATFWNTPIIKAFGRETSSIILFGTILSFVFSMTLIQKPNEAICIMHWLTPAVCITICYAAILTKTNRIVRIFNMNWSSKKRSTPRFISPMSQIVIITLITSVESGILIALIVFNKITTIEEKTRYKRLLTCDKMTETDVITAFLIPILLLSISTFYAFKMRKTPDGFNETRNINFMNFANCVVLITSLFVYILLPPADAVYSLCLQMTLGAFGNLFGLFVPKVYLVLFRKDKNTLESVTATNRNRSQTNISQSGIPLPQNQSHGSLRCRKCHSILPSSTNDPINGDSSILNNTNDKSSQQMYISKDDYQSDDSESNEDFRKARNVGVTNPSFEYSS